MFEQLEKWSLNNREVHRVKQAVEDLSDKMLYAALNTRPAFTHTEVSVTIPTILASFIGVKGDVEEYKAAIYDVNEKMAAYGGLYTKIELPLDKKFPPELLKDLQGAWTPMQREQDVPAEKVVDAFMQSGGLKAPADKNLQKHLRKTLINTIESYRQQSDYRFFEVKNIIFHLIHWYNTYCCRLVEEFDYTRKNPSVLFWGNFSKRELFFLSFLQNLGSDIVTINGVEDPLLSTYMKSNDADIITYPREIEIGDFPSERPQVRMDTVAKQASDQLRDTLHSDDSFCYKPWQFVDYSVRPITMRTTVQEVTILGIEKGMVRQGWEAQAGRVSIPHFFAKINGVNSNQNDYWKTYNTLRGLAKTEVFETLPIEPKQLKLMKNEYYTVFDKTAGAIDQERLLKAAFWPYQQYRTYVQKLIADKCAALCSLDGFKRVAGTPPEMQKIEIFSRMMQLPQKVLQLLQTFDYPADVPKLIVYNNENGQMLSQDDAIIIAFAASAALDVFVFNPAGHNDIEIYLEESELDIHHLDDVAFNLNPKTRSIMGKYF